MLATEKPTGTRYSDRIRQDTGCPDKAHGPPLPNKHIQLMAKVSKPFAALLYAKINSQRRCIL
jgi:hypothetical protein